jgi:putative chitinase
MEEFEINTTTRQAAFIAQLGHESGQFLYMEEIANGSAYDSREDLGNTKPEAISIAKKNNTTPGRFWKGHGPIQITGYSNHLEMMIALSIDCLENPKILCEPVDGCRSAAYFWKSRGLNELADICDFLKISIRINGRNKKTGLPNGWAERQELHERAKTVLV